MSGLLELLLSELPGTHNEPKKNILNRRQVKMDTSNIQTTSGQSFSYTGAFTVSSNQPEFMGHSASPITPEITLPSGAVSATNSGNALESRKSRLNEDSVTDSASQKVEKIEPSTITANKSLTPANSRSWKALRIGLDNASRRADHIELTDETLKQAKKDWQPILTQIENETLSVNATNPGSERTLLHEAAEQGKLEIVKQLMDLGADPSAKTCFGFNALHWASMGGHLDVAQYLVYEKKFNITECTNNEGQDALRISNLSMKSVSDPLKKERYEKLSNWLKREKAA